MKTLYFEGAGSAPRGEVENCRIRTAFHLDNGRAVYLELSCFEIVKRKRKTDKYTFVGVVDSCHYIDQDCNHLLTYDKNFEYTKAEILSFVNSLGASFDAVAIAPALAGYQVFKSGKDGGYYYGDEFTPVLANVMRAEHIKKAIYELERLELEPSNYSIYNRYYPNFSLWVDEQDKGLLHLLRHFNGYNKHWHIRCDVDNWQDTMQCCVLGRYGC